MTKYRIDVYIADDHTMLAEGLTERLNHSNMIHVSRCFTTLAECRTALTLRQPDVLLLDISMPDGDGVHFCQWVTKEYPKIRIIAVTIHDEYSVIQRMLAAGVNGYILKSDSVEELEKAICSVWRGESYIGSRPADIIRQSSESAIILTNTEQSILRLICNGLTNPQIAGQLRLSTETVNWYRKRLLAKFGVKNTAGLVAQAMRQQLV